MKYPHNIEGSKYGKNYRIGYDSKGYAWRIFGETCRYYAYPAHCGAGNWTMIQAGTLDAVSNELSKQAAH